MNHLLTAAIALALAAPSSAGMCSAADQAFYQSTRDAAAGRVSEAQASAAGESAATSGLTAQLATIDFSKAPDSLVILTKAISTLEAELGKVGAAANSYNSAYAVGLGGRVVSVAQNAMASTANAGSAAARTSAGSLAAAIAQVQSVVRPIEAMGLKSELASHLQKAQGIANQCADALSDAGSSHSQIGDCAQKSETADTKEQPKQKLSEKPGTARMQAEQQLSQLKNSLNSPDGSDVKVLKYGPGIGENSQIMGMHDNLLQPGDVAVSPNLLSQYPYGSTVYVDGLPYTVADVSYYAPGNPTTNTVEIWQPPK